MSTPAPNVVEYDCESGRHRWRGVYVTGTNAIRYPDAHIVRRRECQNCKTVWVSVRPL